MINKIKIFTVIAIAILAGITFNACDETSPFEAGIWISPAKDITISRGDTAKFTATIGGIKNVPQNIKWSVHSAENIPDVVPSTGSGTKNDPYLLTENIWKDANFTSSNSNNSERWFKFTATSSYPSYQYIHVSPGTFNNYLGIELYGLYGLYDNNTYMYSDNINYLPGSVYFPVTSGQTYYLKISRYGNSTGTFRVGFNTSSISSSIGEAPAPVVKEPEKDNPDTFIDEKGILKVALNETRAKLVVQAAAAFDKNFTAKVNVNVILPTVNSVTVSPSSVNVARGGTQQFSASVLGSLDFPTDVIWSLVGFNSVTGSGTQANPIVLAANTWASGKISDVDSSQWFKFTATSSSHYIHYDGIWSFIQLYNSSFNAVGSENIISGNMSNYYSSLIVGNVYYIKVSYNVAIGDYKIAFNSSYSAPTNSVNPVTNTNIDDKGLLYVDPNEMKQTITVKATSAWDASVSGTATVTVDTTALTLNTWEYDSISSSSDIRWFKFTASSSYHFIHVNFDTLSDCSVQLYNSNGSTVGSVAYLYSGNKYLYNSSLTSGQTYYIKISSTYDTGAYSIAYNTDNAPAVPTALTQAVWTNGSISTSAAGSAVLYTFDVTGGITYYVWWNDSIEGDSSKTLDVNVRAFYTDGTEVFANTDSGFTSAKQFAASRTGKVIVRVTPKINSSTGSFGVVYSTYNTKPDLPVYLTQGIWEYSSINSSIDEKWFTFTTSSSGYHYIHINFDTLSNCYAQLYNSSGSTIVSQTYLSSGTKYFSSSSLPSGQSYTIKITSYSSNTGTFSIAYNTSNTTPTVPIQLTENFWASGYIATYSGEQLFKFTATNSTQYIHINIGTMTILNIQLYDSNYNTVGNSNLLSNTITSIYKSVTSGDVYYIRVYPYSSSYLGTYKIAFNASSSNSSIETPQPIFNEDFEGGTHSFTIVNGSQTNQWWVGTATAYNSSRSAYISNNSGTSNEYTINSTSVVHMYREIEFPASSTSYTLTFRWKAQGESGYDYLRVFLIDTSTSINAGSQPTGTTLGTYNLGGSTTWNQASISIPVSNSGTTKRLVFTWVNDDSTSSTPPAAIDDILLSY